MTGETEALPEIPNEIDEPDESGESLNVHGGHRSRLRKKLYDGGLKGLKPLQLLEALLYVPIKIKDTDPIAHSLLERYDGNLYDMFRADVEEIAAVQGMGLDSAAFLKAMYEIYWAYGGGTFDGKIYLKTQEAAIGFFKMVFKGNYPENTAVAYIDGNDAIIYTDYVDIGDIFSDWVNAADTIARYALARGRKRCMICYDRPAGELTPYEAGIPQKIVKRLSSYIKVEGFYFHCQGEAEPAV